jgi:hypothetical protein
MTIKPFYSTDLGKITRENRCYGRPIQSRNEFKRFGNEKKTLHLKEKDLIRKDSEYNVPDKIDFA